MENKNDSKIWLNLFLWVVVMPLLTRIKIIARQK